MRTRKMCGQMVGALCLLLTAYCLPTFGQGGTGKMPPNRMPPPMRRMPPPRRDPQPARPPDLKISERQVRDVTVLDLGGKMTGTLLWTATRRLSAAGKKKILLNFSKVESIDSNGRGDLLSSRDLVGNDGGQFKLCKLKRKVRDQLTAAKLLTTFDVYEKEEEALASFR